MKKTGNRPSGQETGLLMHTQDEWWVILEFEEIGYVKDDEKKNSMPTNSSHLTDKAPNR